MAATIDTSKCYSYSTATDTSKTRESYSTMNISVSIPEPPAPPKRDNGRSQWAATRKLHNYRK